MILAAYLGCFIVLRLCKCKCADPSLTSRSNRFTVGTTNEIKTLQVKYSGREVYRAFIKACISTVTHHFISESDTYSSTVPISPPRSLTHT